MPWPVRRRRPHPAASIVLVARVAYGVGLAAAPERLARRWLGPAAATGPTQVALRGLAAREILIHGGALAAARRGAPLRPWLAASVAGDASDVVATALASGLPPGAERATVVVAGGSAALTAAVAALVAR